ncbi:hypothetical protein FOPG_13235 [Fusarium oxysporum f. sp. conglutinans race 2 54008]|uniref:Uncharacterized protein n=1 Tax=Fusarium oxysporum f. sp. conglutinans race 2 54008 TaxID=1089457 RepID=X0H4P5_FUSOX|nr:hypothetical protein FOPG_13235 [Fusarium oxysporum f. sp. conglutinans race 2 54008]
MKEDVRVRVFNALNSVSLSRSKNVRASKAYETAICSRRSAAWKIESRRVCSIVAVPLPQPTGDMRYGILQNRSTVLLNVVLETPTAGKLLYVNIIEVRSGEKRNTY